MYKYLCVWYNMNNNTFYYKFIRYHNEDYYVGFVNQYNHQLIIYDRVSFYVERVSLSYYTRKELRRLISLLEKF